MITLHWYSFAVALFAMGVVGFLVAAAFFGLDRCRPVNLFLAFALLMLAGLTVHFCLEA